MIRKITTFFAAVLLTATIAKAQDSWADLVNETPQEYSVDGNTMRYGDHTYTMTGNVNVSKMTVGAGKVTFTNIPSGYEEFKTVYEEFLGKKPQGAAAMVVMAMEIYGRDHETGQKCFELLCYSKSTVSSAMSLLKQKIVESEDSYSQRYLPAACLDGAAYNNAYAPKKPYTINIKPSVNKPQEMWDGDITFYLWLDGTGGWDTTQRGVDTVYMLDGEMFKVSNFPALYTQCRNIRGKWQGLD